MSCILPSLRASKECTCLNCNELFIPDARNRHHQKYCSKPACRKVSKRAAQQRWLHSEKGADYFSGEDNMRRVRQWRAANPGYWKRKKAHPAEEAVALQDISNLQVIEKPQIQEITQKHTLQDFCFTQPALIVGLIANLTGSALQDDIAAASRRLVDFGRDILGESMPIPKTS